MTDQEIYDRVKTHLLAQNEVSYNNVFFSNTCAYRGTDGLKCAVGCLIPDDLYVKGIEGQGVPRMFGEPGSLIVKVLKAVGIEQVQLGLLIDLQTIHDQTSVNLWSAALTSVAEKYSLVP